MILKRGVIRINWVAPFLLTVGVVTGVACAGPTPEAATPSPTSLPTEVPIATPSPSPLPTQAPTATPSPSPLPTETPSPTHIPMPTANLGKLAYVKGDDIWVKALPDGERKRLTTDARNREPRWSPTGEWLAFRKGDYQVWLMRGDGSAAHALNEGRTVGAFAWAPGEDRLAYVWGEEELQAINADGTDQAVLVPQSLSERIGGIAWSPDGAWIAYEWREQPPGQPPTYQGLWKVSADGKERIELHPIGPPEIGGPLLVGWTGDGRFLLLQDDMRSASLLADGSPLYVLPADGGTLMQLAKAVLAYSDFVVPEPTRTDRVAVVVGGFRAAWTNKVLHVIPASTGEEMSLTSLELAVSSPAWSPDGRRIAYVAMPDEGDLVGGEDARLGMMERRIWVVNAQGQPQAQQLTDEPAYRDERPLWGADGSYILFARLNTEDQASLWLIPAEGGEPCQVVDELTPTPGWFGYYGHVEWDSLYNWYSGE
jgi:Tol biopolymer transport system component